MSNVIKFPGKPPDDEWSRLEANLRRVIPPEHVSPEDTEHLISRARSAYDELNTTIDRQVLISLPGLPLDLSHHAMRIISDAVRDQFMSKMRAFCGTALGMILALEIKLLGERGRIQ